MLWEGKGVRRERKILGGRFGEKYKKRYE